ncbi:MAG: Gfo/Idh/MocA family oxidoreductase [Verrucomicrobiales bacterium]|nr:Gfo/Idh/MocA family oxidoreductase [Verrucomicrobiales bacterium]
MQTPLHTRHVSRSNRRKFLKTVTVAGVAISSVEMPRIARARDLAGKINVGLIGLGVRGYELHEDLRRCKGVRVAGISDLSEHYFDRIKPRLENPQTPAHYDYRRLLDDREIDAIIIATPDHWHAAMTLDALAASKDVYIEKPLTYSLEEAVRVRDKARETGRVTQVGYQRRSIEHFYKAREIVRSGILGEITQIQLWSSRNRAASPWRKYNDYNTEGLPAKSGPEHVDWNRFQANRPARPYDARRFFHWQCYEEYSTGIFGILMSHPLDAANLVLGLDAPESCSATGGIYRYKDDRTVPDTCNALLNYPSRNLTVSFIGSSNNEYFNQEAQYRGTHGTLDLGTGGLRIYAEKRNALFEKFAAQPSSDRWSNLRSAPVFEERAKSGSSTLAHLEDFLDQVRTRGQCKAPVSEGFKAMVGVAMAIQSYRTQRTVRWDSKRDEISG